MAVGNDEISPSSTVKNLGVILDCHLKLNKYMNATCKSFFSTYIYIYLYIYMCVCVCLYVCVYITTHNNNNYSDPSDECFEHTRFLE